MKILTLTILLAASVLSQAQALLNWQPSTNRLVNSNFVMTRRADDGSLDVFNFPSTNAIFTNDQLKDGLNRFAVAQISTNTAGVSAVTPFSGEVWVAKSKVVFVAPLGTNIFILSSTNLGLTGWATVGTNALTFPTAEAQRYFKAVIQLQIRMTNKLEFPPNP